MSDAPGHPGVEVAVPDLVGFGWDEAHRIGTASGLLVRAVGPDGKPVVGHGGVVVEQQPGAGVSAPRGSELALRLAHGGGSGGDRERLRPPPLPREFKEGLDEPLGWADRLRGRHARHEDREPELVGS